LIHQGAMLSAQSRPNGTAQMIASAVPQTAICTVIAISST
jgi:hypothetical protein